jgi:uncharacterized protein (TIGR03067 family)
MNYVFPARQLPSNRENSMRLPLIVTAFMITGCMASSQAPTPNTPQDETEELNGTWKLVSFKYQGVEAVDLLKEPGFVTFLHGDYKWAHKLWPRKGPTGNYITGNHIYIDPSPGKIVYIDPSKNPKEVDYVTTEGDYKGKVQNGIYKLYVDTYIEAFGMPGSPRPTNFDSTRENGVAVTMYKRVETKK